MTDDPHDAWTRIPSSSGPGTASDRAREFVRDLCAHARSYPGAERAEADFEREG